MFTYDKKKNTIQIVIRKREKYNPNKYMKKSDHILVEMVGVDFGLKYGY